MSRKIISNSAAESEQLAIELASELPGAIVIILQGDLGAGKTTFIRGLAKGLGIEEAQVSSPSYTLINEYYGEQKRLIHVDLYRLGDEQEVLELALEDLLDEQTIMAVEWGEKLPQDFPRNLKLEFKVTGDNEREIVISEVQ